MRIEILILTALGLGACSQGPGLSIAEQNASAYWVSAGPAHGAGSADLLVGACCGKGARLYHGDENKISKRPEWEFHGGSPSALTGLCVGFAGDMDGDGYSEIFVGAPRDEQKGSVYLFKGSIQGPSKEPWRVLKSSTPGEGFGELVSAAGDVNGDGYADLAVADFGFDQHRGKVFVFQGGPSGPQVEASWTMQGEEPGDWTGYSLAAGDFDGDGIGDLALGGKNCSGACVLWLAGDSRFELHRQYLRSQAGKLAESTSLVGKLYIYYGSRQGLARKAGFTLEGEQPHANFAFKLLGLGDLDGDGRAELAVSSPGWQARHGRVEVLSGRPRGQGLIRVWDREGAVAGDEWGYMMGTQPLNGQAAQSLLIGSIRDNYALGFEISQGKVAQEPSHRILGKFLGGRIGATLGYLPLKNQLMAYMILDPAGAQNPPMSSVHVIRPQNLRSK